MRIHSRADGKFTAVFAGLISMDTSISKYGHAESAYSVRGTTG